MYVRLSSPPFKLINEFRMNSILGAKLKTFLNKKNQRQPIFNGYGAAKNQLFQRCIAQILRVEWVYFVR